MKIENVKVSDLKAYEKNSRTHSDEQIQDIVKSIDSFGFNNPVLIGDDMELIAGHGRLEAAKLLKMKTVPAIKLSHLTEQQRKAYVIADNKIAMNSDWDYDILKEELALIETFDDDLIDSIGFGELELEELLDEYVPQENKNDEEENSYTKKVDAPIYQIRGEKPEVEELYDKSKTFDLIADISKLDASDDVKDFLVSAAQRHTIIDYQKVAEFYAHSSPEVQTLMENSALVIVDFERAIELGYVKLSEGVKSAYRSEV